MADDLNPWAIIIPMLPYRPNFVIDIDPAIKIPIWPMEEYAIKDFISVWRRQIILVKMAPIRAIEEIRDEMFLDIRGRSHIIRIKP